MDISDGSQKAVQLALQTLKDRCQEYKHLVRLLKEENLALHLKYETVNRSNLDSLTEIDRLNARITELNDQNNQHLRNNTMITTENRKLWMQLSTLSIGNQTIGAHIAKVNNYINESCAQSHIPLVRSKTFTHETAPLKFSAHSPNDESSLDLEEVSLKTEDNNEIRTPRIVDNIIDTSFAFDFHNNIGNNSTIEYFESNLNDIKMFKEIILRQNHVLKTEINNINNIKVNYKCGKCSMHHYKSDEKEANIVDTKQYHDAQLAEESANPPTKSNLPHLNDIPAETNRELESLANWVTPENSNNFFNTHEIDNKDNVVHDYDKICPMCNQLFSVSISFEVFRKHVENHFLETIS